MNKMEKMWRAPYEPPRIDVCAAEPYKFIAASDTTLSGGHEDGDDDGTIDDGDGGGAKGFGFDESWGRHLDF